MKEGQESFPSEKRISVPLRHGLQLVAEVDDCNSPEIPAEISVSICNASGWFLQDIALFRMSCKMDPKAENPVVRHPNLVETLLWGDPDNEDFTDTAVVGIREYDPWELGNQAISEAEARKDVLEFLNGLPGEVFSESGTTKADVLADEDLLERITAEHLHCVNRFGNDRAWSCRDACLVEPGIGK